MPVVTIVSKIWPLGPCLMSKLLNPPPPTKRKASVPKIQTQTQNYILTTALTNHKPILSPSSLYQKPNQTNTMPPSPSSSSSPPDPSTYLSPSTFVSGQFLNKVVFCTGGAGTICSGQVRALVHLGANACIVGRNVEKTEKAAQEIATARPGAKVLGIGGVDVRSMQSLADAVERCVGVLGGIDIAM